MIVSWKSTKDEHSIPKHWCTVQMSWWRNIPFPFHQCPLPSFCVLEDQFELIVPSGNPNAGKGERFTEIENEELIGITIIIESSKDKHLGGMNHSSVSPSSLCCFSFRHNLLPSPSNCFEELMKRGRNERAIGTSVKHIKKRIKGSSFTSSSKDDEGCSMNHTRMTVSRRRCCSFHLHHLPSFFPNLKAQWGQRWKGQESSKYHKRKTRGQKDTVLERCGHQRGTLNSLQIQQRCAPVAFLVETRLLVEVVSTCPSSLLLLPLSLPSCSCAIAAGICACSELLFLAIFSFVKYSRWKTGRLFVCLLRTIG